MKYKGILIPLFLCILFSVILFRPAGRITFDKSVSENRILFQYEVVGCGGLVGKVIDGGKELTVDFVDEYPGIGTNEVVFTSDSDEPKDSYNPIDFQTGGLAGKYTYIIEGTPVGVTEGAPDCCEPTPAYNETVAEFKVDKWYYTSYVPYAAIGNLIVILICAIAGVLCAIWLVVVVVDKIYGNLKMKFIKIE